MAKRAKLRMVYLSTWACAGQDNMKTIDDHIQKDQSEIQSAEAQGDVAKVRHLTEELHSLEEYKEHHPDDVHDPNALELFCEANPDEPECLVYDD